MQSTGPHRVLIALSLVALLGACGDPEPSTLAATSTQGVATTPTSSTTVAADEAPFDFSGAATETFVPLSLSDIGDPSVADAYSASHVPNALRPLEPGEVPPTEEQVRGAIPLLDDALNAEGFQGSVTLWAQNGPSFFGTAPAFTSAFASTDYSVGVYVGLRFDGGLRLHAEQQLFAASQIEEDLPADTPIGEVWLADHVAYGRAGSDNPADWVPGQTLWEWAAFDTGTEMYVVEVNGRSPDLGPLGQAAFLEAAVETLTVMREAGFTRYPSTDQLVFVGDPDTAQMLSTFFTTPCADNFCGPVELPADQ